MHYILLIKNAWEIMFLALEYGKKCLFLALTLEFWYAWLEISCDNYFLQDCEVIQTSRTPAEKSDDIF